MKKTTITFLLIIVLCLSIISVEAVEENNIYEKSNEITLNMHLSSNDKPSFWAIDEIEQLKNINIINEERFSNYQSSTSRLEFVEIIVSTYEYIVGEKTEVDNNVSFIDTNSVYALKAATVGISDGVSKDEFAPENLVTREQMATMLIRMLDLANIEYTKISSLVYSDNESISTWARNSVYYATENYYLNGIGNNLFAPKKNTTNEQALVMVYRIIEELKEKDFEDYEIGLYKVVKDRAAVHDDYYGVSDVVKHMALNERVNIIEFALNEHGNIWGKTYNDSWIFMEYLKKTDSLTNTKGIYLTNKDNVPLRNGPSSELRTQKSLENDTLVNIANQVYNHSGNLWGLTDDNYYIYMGNLEVAENDLSFPLDLNLGWDYLTYRDGHKGISYSAVDFNYDNDEGAIVKAIENGRIVIVDRDDGMYVIEHTVPLILTYKDETKVIFKWYSMYAHMNLTESFALNEIVEKEEKIGEVSDVSSKYDVDYHLHFNISTVGEWPPEKYSNEIYNKNAISPLWIDNFRNLLGNPYDEDAQIKYENYYDYAFYKLDRPLSELIVQGSNEVFDLKEDTLSSAKLSNTYRLINVGADKDLNTSCNSGQAANLTNINLWTKSESSSDHYFNFKKVATDTYMIKSMSNSKDLYLNIYGNTKSDIRNGSNIQLYNNTGSGMGDFQFHRLDNGNYIIMYDDNNNLVLTAEGTSRSSNVSLKTYTGSNLQQWKLSRVDISKPEPEQFPEPEPVTETVSEFFSTSKKYRLVNVGSDLDMNTSCNTGEAAKLTNINLWTKSNSSGDHQFKFKDIGNDTYMIRSLSNTTELYLNIYGNTKADIKSGSNIHLYSYSTSGMSDFQIKKLDNGNYKIMYDDANSLVLSSDGTAKGSNVILKTYTGSNLQQWKLVEVE